MADIDSYYLSSKNSLNSNKEYIIVKLTDSALKCLEECQNLSKNGSGKSPSIKFLGNHGFLSFPTSGTNSNSNQPVEQKFSFSIADIEGPQGAFECIQQSHGQMNVLGALQYKMIIQAKEDVFAQTRTAMTMAAEMQNNKRTREIKPSQTDIGRKVIKPSSKSLYNRTTTSSSLSSSGTPNLSLKNHSMQNRLPLSGLSGSGSQANNNSSSSSSFSTSLSSSLLGGINEKNSCKDDDGIGDRGGGGGYNNHHDSHSSYSNNYGSTIPASNINNNNNNTNSRYHHNPVNGVVSNDCNDSLHNNSKNRNAGQAHHRNPDIMKRSIKERLIHLLALRPFKKPELYARITSEGIRDRDKHLISNVIKTISHVRDNAYELNRHIWNDVHEDWPFYTETEKQILKRRKPQNLTPPLSSDGGSSSASGQSPGSTHNGSPPPAVKRPSSTIASLNNSNDNYSEPTSKKPRISRVKIPERVSSGPVRSSSASLYDHSRVLMNSRPRDDDYYGPNAHESEDSGMGSLTYSVLRNETKRASLTPPMMEISSNGVNMNGATGSPKNAAILNDGSRKHMANQMMASSNNNKNNNLNISNNYDTNVQSMVVSSMGTGGNNTINSSNNYSTSPKLQPPPQQQQQQQQQHHQQQHNPTIQPITNKASSPGSAINSNTSLQSVSSSNNNNNNNNNSSRNLILEYPQITSVEQRRRYKTEFDNDYAEYLQLHSIIENVSKRFAQLEEELRNVKHNDKKYKEIKKQIIKEYRENNDNSSFIEKKSRFQHLHEKLKHIKHLVGEFDKCLEQQNGNVTAPATATY